MEKEFPDEEWRSADLRKFLWSWLKMEQYPKIPMPAGWSGGMETGGEVISWPEAFAM